MKDNNPEVVIIETSLKYLIPQQRWVAIREPFKKYGKKRARRIDYIREEVCDHPASVANFIGSPIWEDLKWVASGETPSEAFYNLMWKHS